MFITTKIRAPINYVARRNTVKFVVSTTQLHSVMVRVCTQMHSQFSAHLTNPFSAVLVLRLENYSICKSIFLHRHLVFPAASGMLLHTADPYFEPLTNLRFLPD
jgi:hypothetical protein